jgi:hypothetical protein
MEPTSFRLALGSPGAESAARTNRKRWSAGWKRQYLVLLLTQPVELVAQFPGFKRAETQEFRVEVGARQRIDITLELGEANQTVEGGAAWRT